MTVDHKHKTLEAGYEKHALNSKCTAQKGGGRDKALTQLNSTNHIYVHLSIYIYTYYMYFPFFFAFHPQLNLQRETSNMIAISLKDSTGVKHAEDYIKLSVAESKLIYPIRVSLYIYIGIRLYVRRFLI